MPGLTSHKPLCCVCTLVPVFASCTAGCMFFPGAAAAAAAAAVAVAALAAAAAAPPAAPELGWSCSTLARTRPPLPYPLLWLPQTPQTTAVSSRGSLRSRTRRPSTLNPSVRLHCRRACSASRRGADSRPALPPRPQSLVFQPLPVPVLVVGHASSALQPARHCRYAQRANFRPSLTGLVPKTQPPRPASRPASPPRALQPIRSVAIDKHPRPCRPLSGSPRRIAGILPGTVQATHARAAHFVASPRRCLQLRSDHVPNRLCLEQRPRRTPVRPVGFVRPIAVSRPDRACLESSVVGSPPVPIAAPPGPEAPKRPKRDLDPSCLAGTRVHGIANFWPAIPGRHRLVCHSAIFPTSDRGGCRENLHAWFPGQTDDVNFDLLLLGSVVQARVSKWQYLNRARPAISSCVNTFTLPDWETPPSRAPTNRLSSARRAKYPGGLSITPPRVRLAVVWTR